MGNPATDMRNGGTGWGSSSEAAARLKDTPSTLQSALQAGHVGPGPRRGADKPPLRDSGLAEGTTDPQFAPSELGKASREELGIACTTASCIFLFSKFWVFHITF